MIYGKGVYALVEVWTRQSAARNIPTVFRKSVVPNLSLSLSLCKYRAIQQITEEKMHNIFNKNRHNSNNYDHMTSIRNFLSEII